jgi:hypothetical protein
MAAHLGHDPVAGDRFRDEYRLPVVKPDALAVADDALDRDLDRLDVGRRGDPPASIGGPSARAAIGIAIGMRAARRSWCAGFRGVGLCV